MSLAITALASGLPIHQFSGKPMLGMKIMERMGRSQATTVTAQRLANTSVQRLANARYEDDGEDGYEPGYNSHHSRPCSEKGEYTCKEKARHYFHSLHEINFSISQEICIIFGPGGQ